ncbi:MAG: hypothetical protein HY074_06880 [Deltaproteobacteria bacterium]|nr:hypothetical protein [Deltaproteobacteria bacterium]
MKYRAPIGASVVRLAAIGMLITTSAAGDYLKQKAGVCGCAVSPRADHLFEDVRQFCPEVSGAPELMACMPASMRANYVLMYDTGSPQCASADSPRLVLFSEDGKSMVSFPGKHGAPGCDAASVEFISFDSKEKRYSPAKIIFDGKNQAHFHVSPSDETGKCTQCHDKDFHPNWSSYPFWPGSYGSNHSRIVPGTPEAGYYKQFAAKAAKDPLYSQLQPVPSLKQGQPFSFNAESPPGEKSAKLNMAITRRNAERLVRKLKESPGYDRLKYRLLSGLLNALKPELKSCQPFDEGEINEARIAVSEDFRAERAVVNGKLKNQSEAPPKKFKREGNGRYASAEENAYALYALQPPDRYPTRTEVEADPAKAALLKTDKFVRNSAVLLLMTQKLGISDTDDFFNRPSSTRFDGGKKVFSIDRTNDFDTHLGPFLAQALLADIAQDEAVLMSSPLRAGRYPFSSYIDPDRPGLEDEVCLRYDYESTGDKPINVEKSIQEARRVYGTEECRNGIREFPANQGAMQAPSICEKLRRADTLGPCPGVDDKPLGSDPQDSVDKGLAAAQNVGNPMLACASCHDGSHPPIPKFPFGDPKALSYELNAPGSNLKDRIMKQVNGNKMPPGGGLKTTKEKTAIEKYLSEI